MLFDAFELRGVRLRNRLCAAPLASSSGDGLGLPTERSFKVYGKIAASGVALVNVEHCAVNPSGRVRPEQFLADSGRAAAAREDRGADKGGRQNRRRPDKPRRREHFKRRSF